MTEINEQVIEQLDRANARALHAEQMLGFVLLAIGEPVIVPKALIVEGFPEGATIAINEHLEDEAFVFSVEVDCSGGR